MITAHHHMLVILAFTTFFLVVPALPAHAESILGFRGTMIRRAHDTGTTTTAINFTQAVQDSHRRLAFLASRSRVNDDDKQSSASHLKNNSTDKVPLRMDGGGGAYDMEFSIGTPPQKLTAIADTGSDLIWTKCGTAAAAYHPSASSTFAKLPCSDPLCTALQSDSRAQCAAGGDECDYRYSYGLGGEDPPHYTQGFLGSETFTLGGDAARGIGFGCTTSSEGEYGDGSGLVGLGRGPLSLVSQLDAGTFMYCLTSDASTASPLLFGSLARLTGAGVQSTGLLASATFYAVNLRSISIGSATTAGVGGGPDGGVVFDSGTTLTFLADPAYTEAKAAFMAQMMGRFTQVEDRYGFEACYEKPAGNGRQLSSAVPTMVLRFDGGADMALPVHNYVVEVDDDTVCWVVQRSPSLSVIGNIMQVNYLVLHDVRRSVLSFQPANCDSYQVNQASGGSPRSFLSQFCTMLLCFCIYMYTSIF